LDGVTEIDATVAALTVKLADPDTPFNDALMDVLPAAMAEAMPADVMVATEVTEEVQVALAVIFRTEPSA
jgi:hypothetical protein